MASGGTAPASTSCAGVDGAVGSLQSCSGCPSVTSCACNSGRAPLRSAVPGPCRSAALCWKAPSWCGDAVGRTARTGAERAAGAGSVLTPPTASVAVIAGGCFLAPPLLGAPGRDLAGTVAADGVACCSMPSSWWVAHEAGLKKLRCGWVFEPNVAATACATQPCAAAPQLVVRMCAAASQPGRSSPGSAHIHADHKLSSASTDRLLSPDDCVLTMLRTRSHSQATMASAPAHCSSRGVFWPSLLRSRIYWCACEAQHLHGRWSASRRRP